MEWQKMKLSFKSYVYGTVRHLDSWIRRDQLDVICLFISLFNAQHVSDVNTSILRSLWLICWVISWVVLLWFDVCWCYGVVRQGWCGILIQAEALVLSVFFPSKYSLFHNSNVFVSCIIHILYVYSTNIGTEYFKHGIYSPCFFLQNAVCFIILTYLVPVLFTSYMQCVLKLKK